MSVRARINLSNCVSKPFELYENLNISNKEKYGNTGNQLKVKAQIFTFLKLILIIYKMKLLDKYLKRV